jgi:hypothetical protein
VRWRWLLGLRHGGEGREEREESFHDEMELCWV